MSVCVYLLVCLALHPGEQQCAIITSNSKAFPFYLISSKWSPIFQQVTALCSLFLSDLLFISPHISPISLLPLLPEREGEKHG